MAGMNDIKARIKSVESTMQITKAMELVATSKLRRAKETVERTRPFYETLGEAIASITAGAKDFETDWFLPREGKTLLVVIAGDRGLAGGYNANVFRLAESLKDEDTVWLPVGKKAIEYYKHRKREIVSDEFEYVSDQGVGSALRLGEIIASGYKSGEYGKIKLVYTEFVSMMTQRAVSKDIFPLIPGESTVSMEADCAPVDMLDKIIPMYAGGVIYSAICESLASESGARRAAMNSANKNAGEMIDTLMLSYNRARQAVITQEITEIVSGAEAL